MAILSLEEMRIEDGRTTDAVELTVEVRTNSIGICMVGGVTQDDHTVAEDNFEPAQWESLKKLCDELHETYPKAEVKGHYHLINLVLHLM